MPVMAGGEDLSTDDELAYIKEAAVLALSDGLLNPEEMGKMGEMLARRRRENERLIREDEAACSDPREYAEDGGTIWRYVIVSDRYARIIGCETASETIEIPVRVQDMPVAEIAVDGCSYLDSVRSIVCPSQIEKIGACAFRGCKDLEKLVLPFDMDEFDSSWMRNCKSLRDLTLPGMLARVTPAIFEEGDLRALSIGPGTYELMPGTFARGKLESISIDEGNPYISTDGKAVFAHNGAHLRMLALSCEHYEVPNGCEVIEKKAFANRAELKSVGLPDSLTAIEDHAFSYSGLESFDAPAGLRSIGERAFFRCRELASVTLNSGLVSIGDEAFTGTAIEHLEAPASLEVLGNNIAADTKLSFAGQSAGFTIAPEGILELDQQGGLYRNAPDGLHFVRMLDPDLDRYEVKQGTIEIEDHAFAKHKHISQVVLPEGLLRIRHAAFRECLELARADFPSTLEELESEAFLDTALERVLIPKALKSIGETALITHGAHNGNVAPSLMSIDVDAGNERFYAVPGLLLERHEQGAHVVVYADAPDSSIRIPEDVVAIDSYAFGGARNLKELSLTTRIRKINMRGLSLDCLVEHFHIDLIEPIEGHESIDLYFPKTARSAHEIQLAFNLSTFVDLNRIMKHYDSAIVNMHEFDQRRSAEEFDVYGQAKLALERLADPVLMTDTNRTMLMQSLTDNIEDVCEAVARHDDRKAIDDMLELDILNKDNLLGIIDRIGKLQDAAMTGYLLEVKRRLFDSGGIDFDL